jgi:hypothetical protein
MAQSPRYPNHQILPPAYERQVWPPEGVSEEKWLRMSHVPYVGDKEKMTKKARLRLRAYHHVLTRRRGELVEVVMADCVQGERRNNVLPRRYRKIDLWWVSAATHGLSYERRLAPWSPNEGRDPEEVILGDASNTMSVEQLDKLTMGNLDLVPRVEFPGLTLVFTTTGGQVPVRAANVRTLPEERDLDLEDRLFYESRSYPTVVFAKGRRDGTIFCTSVDQQFLTCSDTAIVIDGDGTDGTGMVTRNRWDVHFTGTFSEIIQALNEQYRQIKDVKK